MNKVGFITNSCSFFSYKPFEDSMGGDVPVNLTLEAFWK
jgi:hypothetical protein